MGATDAQALPIKAAACRVYFPLLDADGDLVTGGGSDTPDTERSIDGGTFADCSNEMTEVATNSGMYYIDLNASEMTGDCICLIAKTATAGTKTTPIVIYTAKNTTGWNILSDVHSTLDAWAAASGVLSNIYSDTTRIESDLIVIDAAIDSDSVLYLADHDKTQSDIALLSSKADSDAVLADADHDKTQSDVALLSTKLGSDMTIISDAVAAVDAAIDSDSVLYLADHDKTQSDIALVDAAIDSDSVLYLADHDKTQSDIALLSTKVDSDAVLADADHDKTQSDLALVYSDTTVIEAAGGALTAGQASDLAAIESELIIVHSETTVVASDCVVIESDTTAIEAAGGALTAGQASDLAAIESDLKKTPLSDMSDILSDILDDTAALDSDFLAVEGKLDSDAVLADADHDKTQSDIALVYSDTTAMPSDVVSNLMANSPTAGTDTVADILKAVYAHARGKMAVDGNDWKFYDDDDSTLLFTLTWSSPNRTTA